MTNITRYFLELSYKGTAYHGWQVQPNAITLQEVLDKALSIFFRQKVETTGCGRTDTGVHATQFFAHFDLLWKGDQNEGIVANSINSLLPFDISVKRIFQTKPDAHARFDATLRSYEYHIHFNKDPFLYQRSWLLRDKLDLTAMNQAAEQLLNYTDFSCFSKSKTQVYTNNCKIVRAEWRTTSNGIAFYISADRFLRNMVRAIVGTMVDMGRGKIAPQDIHNIIQSKNRSNAGASVPACGLYLSSVEYPYI